jgi:hypothetical protein
MPLLEREAVFALCVQCLFRGGVQRFEAHISHRKLAIHPGAHAKMMVQLVLYIRQYTSFSRALAQLGSLRQAQVSYHHLRDAPGPLHQCTDCLSATLWDINYM